MKIEVHKATNHAGYNVVVSGYLREGIVDFRHRDSSRRIEEQVVLSEADRAAIDAHAMAIKEIVVRASTQR